MALRMEMKVGLT